MNLKINSLKLAVLSTAMAASCAVAEGAEPSGTLPVIYINTQNAEPVTSKEKYLDATLYLDPKGSQGIEAIGSAENPVTLKIKGRGNYTWVGFDKKPYRLKFTDKQPLMGMKKNKHFGLLAHTDDNMGFLRNATGFELSRRIGLAWTPADAPVEYVLNGDYLGVYFLTELIRVDKNRVNIAEQPDMTSRPDSITGGWLVEIDNYDSDPNVEITEGNGERIILTYKTPELLSAEQENFLRSQALAMNAAIYDNDKSSTKWEEYIDIDALARYYIVQELMDDCESFHGSCYMHRQMGDDQKWVFGPVWDFGNAFQRGTDRFIWDGPQFNQTWIGEIYKFPRFQEKVKQVWAEFIANGYEGMTGYISSYAERIASAAVNSSHRWPQYGNQDVLDKAALFKSMFVAKAQWLGKQWGTPVPSDISDLNIYVRGNHNGWNANRPMEYRNGKFVAEGVDLDGNFKIGDDTWTDIDYGANDSGEPLRIGVPYSLKFRGGNLTLNDNPTLKGARITYDHTDHTLLVEDPLGINDINGEATCGWTINGLELNANDYIRVYTLSGTEITSGQGHIMLPCPGIYIIADSDGATKVSAR